MSEYQSNCTLQEIGEILQSSERIMLTSHAKPDGDAFGSVLALAHALDLAGKSTERWVMPPLVDSLHVLNTKDAKIHLYEHESDPLPVGEPDIIIILDTGSWTQLAPLKPWLVERRDRIIVLDHHLHGDLDVGHRLFVDTTAGSVCEIVADLIDVLGVNFDQPIADALYVGIASDTGWFRFSNTTPRTHTLAARLISLGVNHTMLYQRLSQSERLAKLLLLTRALENTQFLADGKIALMTLRAGDFVTTGARYEETERLVDVPQMVADVQVVVLLTEVDDNHVRLSFRSKPGPDAIDVNALARRFGGGGHARASGAKVDEPLNDVRDRLIDELCAVV